MSKRKQRTATSISLFPFLAVLVCTMGALILLLLVTTRRVRQQVIARELAVESSVLQAEAEPAPRTLPEETAPPPREVAGPLLLIPAPPARDLEAEREAREERERLRAAQEAEWQAKLAELESTRVERQRALRARQATLTAAEEDLQRLQEKLAAVRNRLKESREAQRETTDAHRALAAEQQALLDDIAFAEKKIGMLKAQHAVAGSQFAFVPYDGSSGTTRRPIFIECSADGLRILPEGEFLGPQELSGFTDGYNPLLLGARALSDYWTGKGDLKPETVDKTPPYVLLLVRPGGAITYHIARKLLTNLGQPFGYELIEDDYPLYLPPPDPQAKLIAQSAIREALAERAQIVGNSSLQRRLTGTVIEFDSFDASADDGPESLPEGSGHRSGGSGNPSEPTSISPARSGLFASNSQQYGGTGRRIGPSGAPSPGGTPGFGGTSSSSMSGAGGAGGPASGSPSTGRIPGRPLPGHSLEAGNGAGGGEPGTLGAGGDSDYAQIGLGPGPAEQELPRGGSGAAFPAGSSLVRSGGGNGGPPKFDPFAAERASPPGALTEPPPQEIAAGVPGSSAGVSRGSKGSAADPLLSSQGTSPDGTIGSEPGRLQGPSLFAPGGAMESGGNAPSGNAASGNPQSGASAGQTTPSFSSQTSSDPAAGGATPSFSHDFGPRRKSRGASREELARQRWGQAREGTIGFERSVAIHIAGDKIVIDKGKVVLPIGRGESKEELLEGVLSAIDEQSRNWGPPPARFYWVPAVRFTVTPEGSQHYERVNSALREWGLATSVRFVAEPPQPARGTE